MRCLLGGGVNFTFPFSNAAFIGGRRLKEEIQYAPCIMCVQYIGGCSVHRGVFSTSGGYHEYIGGCSVHRGDIMMNVGGYHDKCGDTMSTSGDVQYIGGIS